MPHHHALSPTTILSSALKDTPGRASNITCGERERERARARARARARERANERERERARESERERESERDRERLLLRVDWCFRSIRDHILTVREHILPYESTFYRKRTHSIIREHILS